MIGAAGLIAAATDFSVTWTVGELAFSEAPTTDLWTPIVVFLLVALGLLANRRSE